MIKRYLLAVVYIQYLLKHSQGKLALYERFI
jgi:hypothetical protein